MDHAIDNELTCRPDGMMLIDILAFAELTERKILVGMSLPGSVIHNLPVAALLQPDRVLTQMASLDIHLVGEVPLTHRTAEVGDDAAPMLTTSAVHKEHLSAGSAFA